MQNVSKSLRNCLSVLQEIKQTYHMIQKFHPQAFAQENWKYVQKDLHTNIHISIICNNFPKCKSNPKTSINWWIENCWSSHINTMGYYLSHKRNGRTGISCIWMDSYMEIVKQGIKRAYILLILLTHKMARVNGSFLEEMKIDHWQSGIRTLQIKRTH